MTDGFSTPITKTIYFEIPNSKPTLALDKTNAKLSSEIGSGVSLESTGVLLTIADSDSLDVTDRTLKVSMDIKGGLASYDGEYEQLVTISGGKVTVAHDGSTVLPAGKTWIDVLTEVASDIIITRGVVGSATASISVEDLEGGPGAANVSFAFEPKALAKPQILTSAENPAAGESLVLNGTEFDAGKLRVFIKDVGASVGDEVVLTTKIGGVAQTVDKKTIPASGTSPDAIVPFVDFNLQDLVSEGVKNGAYEITAALHIGGVQRSTSDTTDPVTFSVDTISPVTPKIEFINLQSDAVPTVSNSDIATLTVSDSNTEKGLTHSIVKILGPKDGDWYELPTDFDLNSIRLGTGQFIGEISPTSAYDDVNDVYALDLGTTKLDDGVYAVIARDSVGNVSTVDTSTFNVSTGTYPSAVFVVDQTLDARDIGYAILNAQYIDGVDYRFYKLGADQASGIELGVRPQALGAMLPADVVGLKVEVWADSANLGSTTVSADVVAEFERDLTAKNDYWSKKSGVAGTHVEISSTKSAELAPVVVLDLESGLSGVSGFVGIRISVEDIAGNIIYADTPADQIELDLVADETVANAPNEGKVTSVISEDIFTGISRSEAKALSVELIGLDVDADARTSFVLSLDQLSGSLKYKADNSAASSTRQSSKLLKWTTLLWELANGAKVPSFNTREFYLDVGSAFLSSLAHKTSSAAPSSLGEVADWKIIGVQAADFSLKAVAEGTTPTPPTANPVGKAEYNADGSKLTVLVYDTTTKDAAGAESKLYIDGSAVTGGVFTLGTSGGPSTYVLSGTAGDYTSSTVVGWETNSVSGFASALKAEYISHSDWNDYALGVTAKANLDVYLSSYIVNTHKEETHLQN